MQQRRRPLSAVVRMPAAAVPTPRVVSPRPANSAHKKVRPASAKPMRADVPPQQQQKQREEEQGCSLQDYEVLEELGRGSYGVVHRARDKRDGRLYALKSIKVGHLSAAHQRATLEEVLNMRRVDHRNIVSLHAAFVDGKQLYLVMEYAEKGDFRKLCKKYKAERKHFGEAELWQFFWELCQGLHHLHDRRIIHRDLKTMNIFLSKDNHIKLGDLGVSRLMEGETTSLQTRVGTPLYLAPELVDKKRYGLKADIWSLGVVFYTLTALQEPFTGTTMFNLGFQIMHESPPPLPKFYSPMLGAFVLKLLEKDPKKRPDITQVIAAFPIGVQKFFARQSNRATTRSPPVTRKPSLTELQSIVDSFGLNMDLSPSRIGSISSIRGTKQIQQPVYHHQQQNQHNHSHHGHSNSNSNSNSKSTNGQGQGQGQQQQQQGNDDHNHNHNEEDAEDEEDVRLLQHVNDAQAQRRRNTVRPRPASHHGRTAAQIATASDIKVKQVKQFAFHTNSIWNKGQHQKAADIGNAKGGGSGRVVSGVSGVSGASGASGVSGASRPPRPAASAKHNASPVCNPHEISRNTTRSSSRHQHNHHSNHSSHSNKSTTGGDNTDTRRSYEPPARPATGRTRPASAAVPRVSDLSRNTTTEHENEQQKQQQKQQQQQQQKQQQQRSSPVAFHRPQSAGARVTSPTPISTRSPIRSSTNKNIKNNSCNNNNNNSSSSKGQNVKKKPSVSDLASLEETILF